jgi:predicted DNA-binding transcriptional regulator YafY
VLRANYATEEGPVERDLEPIGIFHEHGTWNAIAYCHLLKDYRHFRVERILALAQTNKLFHRQHKTLTAYLEEVKVQEQVFPAVIEVENQMARYLQEQKFDYGFKKEEQGKTHTRMIFDAPCIQAFSRWYVTFADHAKIIEPVSLKTLLKERLTNLLKAI